MANQFLGFLVNITLKEYQELVSGEYKDIYDVYIIS